MTKKHFEVMARHIAEMENRQEAANACNAFMWLARQFNPRFSASQFAQACGFKPLGKGKAPEGIAVIEKIMDDAFDRACLVTPK